MAMYSYLEVSKIVLDLDTNRVEKLLAKRFVEHNFPCCNPELDSGSDRQHSTAVHPSSVSSELCYEAQAVLSVLSEHSSSCVRAPFAQQLNYKTRQ